MIEEWKKQNLDELYEEFQEPHGEINQEELVDYLIREYMARVKEQCKAIQDKNNY